MIPDATISSAGRVDLIDALRGLALLGILWINMTGHALPFFSMWNPTIAGGDDPVNLGAWATSEIVVEGAMRGLFSLLFGVSMLLFMRVEDRAALFARRNLWLIGFGLIHGFLLLMPGDILVTYGVCAFLIFPLRHAPTRLLAAASIACTLLLAGIEFADSLENRALAQAASAPGASSETIEEFAALTGPPPQVVADLNERAKIGYSALLPYMAGAYWETLTSWTFPKMIVDALAMMFAGMALYRAGLFSDRWPYTRLMLFGGLLAAAAIAARAAVIGDFMAHGYVENINPAAEAVREIARPTLAVAYAVLFAGLWRSGALGGIAAALKALGRTAFTHYIGGTIIATTLFYGHGFGLYGKFDRIGVYAIIIAVWTAQTLFSLAWLRHFRAGPLEWAWRSLVAGAPQPFRR